MPHPRPRLLTALAPAAPLAALAAGLLWPAPALAHIHLDEPTNRYDTLQKDGPCGRAAGTRSANVTVLESGATITLRWQETVNHPSHYRISFDADGDDDFVDPAAIDDFFTNGAVLIDNIPDEADQRFEVQVTLPDIECDNCTLQLIQVMYDKSPPLGRPGTIFGDDDIYYNCADLVLRRPAGAPDAGPGEDPVADAGVDQPGEPDGGRSVGPDAGGSPPPATGNDLNGGCAVDGGRDGATGLWLWALVALVALPLRRPRRPR